MGRRTGLWPAVYWVVALGLCACPLLWCASGLAQAPFGATGGLGEVAEQLSAGPVSAVMKFFYGACYVVGAIMLWKAYEMYGAHRAIPTYCGIWGAIFMAMIGIAALLIPLVHYGMRY